MTGPEHYAAAEQLISRLAANRSSRPAPGDDLLELALTHALLAAAAAMYDTRRDELARARG